MTAGQKTTSLCPSCGHLFELCAEEFGCPVCLLELGIGDGADHENAERAEALPGEFGTYAIARNEDGSPCELGRGAMGVTYRAIDSSLNREVALKIIRNGIELNNADARERFMREARAAAALRHPNVATIYQFGIREETGQCFCAMEILEGETLADRVRRTGPLEMRSVLQIARQITDALTAAEKRGLVHRDLKPANIMIQSVEEEESRPAELTVKIIDFGIAKALAETPDARVLTHDGFIGTPAFASPEQFNGAPVDVRSDIYSLGATLWFLLTGHMPFGQDRINLTALPTAQLKAAHLPSCFVALLRAMLSPEPAGRPGVRELAKRLEAIQSRFNAPGKPFRRLAFVAGAMFLTAGAAFLLLHPRWADRAPSTESVSEKSIAVLPFENISAEKENAFFADGIQDDILTALAKVADLKVISRTSVIGYAATSQRDMRAIGQALRVVYVLEGNVRRAGGRVRVTARLIDTRTNTQVLAETYDREVADVFAIQSEIAQQITTQLKAKLSPNERAAIEQPATADLVAFDLYTQAKTSRLMVGYGPFFKERMLESVKLLDRAVARDPRFLVAWCELATTHDYLYFAGYDHTPARLHLAENAVRTALHLDPDSGGAHLAFAQHLYNGYRDYGRARTELEIARRTLPNSAEIVALTGYMDRRQGRWAESTQNLERAIELDPRNWFTLSELSVNYSHLRRYARAAVVLDRAVAIVPKDGLMKVVRAWVDFDWKGDPTPLHTTIAAIMAEDPTAAGTVAGDWLFLALCERDLAAADRALAALTSDDALTLGHMLLRPAFGAGLLARVRGNEVEAHAAFTTARHQQEDAVRSQPENAPALCVLALIDAGLGRKEEALREGRRALELLPVERDALAGADMIVAFAIICAWIDEKDLAFEHLAIAAQIPGLVSYGQLKLHPWWDKLRDDPRFAEIVAKLAPTSADQ